MSEQISGQIVKNASSAYNYKYSSLADLHKAGINIPKMKTGKDGDDEFIYYWDGKEWQQGARVVPIESKSMNAAQAYGASLTYARRYTVQLAEAVACDDDDAIEQAPKGDIRAKKSYGGISFDDIRSELAEIDDEESVLDYARELKTRFSNPTEKQSAFIKKMIADRIKEIKGEL
jgi:hypothetical protein